MKYPLIGIIGGIGSGKSIVSRMLSVMGYPVFDCDSEARRIMDCSDEIKHRIRTEIADRCITSDGCIDRPALSAVVFSDKAMLLRLNAIVHEAVRKELKAWAVKHSDYSPAFVETAIPFESGLDRMVDGLLEVTAPDEIRIRRVMLRNGLTAAEVQRRIDSQRRESAIARLEAAEAASASVETPEHPGTAEPVPAPIPHVTVVDNTGALPLLPQILSFLAEHCAE